LILFGLCYECIAVSYGMVLLLLWYTHTLLSVRVTHPRVLRTALFWPCVLRTAILWPRVLRTVKQLKNHFWRFHLHKQKYAACDCTIILENVSFDVFVCC